jgi:hypothetical protein
MLSFDNRPPLSPEEVHISESGHTLLEAAIKSQTEWALIAYGRAAVSELVDAFEGESSPQELETYSREVFDEVYATFGPHVNNFASGMKQGAHKLVGEEIEVIEI